MHQVQKEYLVHAIFQTGDPTEDSSAQLRKEQQRPLDISVDILLNSINFYRSFLILLSFYLTLSTLLVVLTKISK